MDIIKKYTLLFIFLIIYCSNISASSDSTKKVRNFKIYVNSKYYEPEDIYTQNGYTYTTDGYDFKFGNISLALETKKRKKISHEFELMPFSFEVNQTKTTITKEEIGYNDLTGGSTTISYEASLRYQFNYYILHNNDSKLRPYIGFSTRFYYSSILNKPLTSSAFRSRTTFFYLPVELLPSLDIRLSEKMYFNINIPIELNRFKIGYEKIDDPQLPEKLRSTTTPRGVLLPKIFHLRFGLCYVLNNKNS